MTTDPGTHIDNTETRKLVAHLFITLDGVVEAPNEWSLDYWHEDIGADIGSDMSRSDAMLLGRVTYQEFTEAWAGRTNDDDPGAEHMNSVTKYVASRTLTTTDWANSHLLPGNLAEAVTDLKNRPGGDIMISGSATLVRALLAENLLDELDLLLYPVVRGHGARLFLDGTKTQAMTLEHCHRYENGVVRLTYRPHHQQPRTATS